MKASVFSTRRGDRRRIDQEARLVALLDRMVAHGLLPARAAHAHPAIGYERLCGLSLEDASAHRKMESLSLFQTRCAEMGIPPLAPVGEIQA